MDKLYIVMPAYNEEANIEAVIKEWYPIVEKYNGNGESRLVIVNDGSKDSTLSICRKLMGGMPLLEIINRANSGHGATILYAYHYAVAEGADYIFQTDSDGQTVPEEFEEFWVQRKEYSVLIGWRNQREDGRSRIFVTKTLKIVLKIIFGIETTDANTPFRLMKKEVLEKYIADIPEDFFLTNVILTVMFLRNHEKIKFIPITFRPRQGGKNSINFIRIVKIGWKAVGDFRLLKEKWEKKDADSEEGM